ncbi:class I SAM-dependent methyltransferase [Atopobacter phocae]|uniref:class I SAM-dependent methyltransferase n=1 Tax=Atopobacter phocae TaxID=136492 RepID=UPI000471B2DF|nr:class I SAM-dependent methyltransferase [Atopobacter phocae]
MHDQSIQAYQLLQQMINRLKEDVNASYMETLTETLQNIADDGKIQIVDGLPHSEVVVQLQQLYSELKAMNLSTMEWRKAMQLSFYKGSQEDAIQANHLITPEAVSLLVSIISAELMQKTFKDVEPIQVMDLAVGGSFLLSTVVAQLNEVRQAFGVGVDNDDLLIALAQNVIDILKQPIKLYHQDSLQHLLIDPVHLAVSDLPIGYYPVESVSASYQLKRTDGMSYAHELLIEQHLNHLKPDGWGMFILPMHQLTEDAVKRIMMYLKNVGYLQGVLSFPSEFFKKENEQKGLLIIQKAGDKAKQAPHILYGEMPRFNDIKEARKFIASFKNWNQTF